MTAQQLKNSILQMAVQGKLVPQDPNDEPASVLLDRIRMEKIEMVKEGKIKKEKNLSVIFRGDDGLFYEKVGDQAPACIEDELPFEIPESWEWIRLGELCDIINGFTPLRSNPEFWENGTIKWFTIDDIHDQGRRIKSTRQLINDRALTKGTKRILPEGTVLLCCTASVGEFAIAETPLITNQQFNGLVIKDLYYNLYYNEFLFKIAETFKDRLIEVAGKTTFNFVSVKKLSELIIPIPPMEEQHRITEKLETVSPYIKQYETEETKLSSINASFPDQLKKSILQFAVQGKLVSQDASDEPASVLLERIRAEKEQLIESGKIKRDKHESVIYRRDDSYYEKVDGVERCIDDEIPFDIPESWEWCRLQAIVNVVSARRVHQSDWRSKGIPFYRAREIAKLADDGFVKNELFISLELFEEYKESGIPHANDLMVTAVGTLGKTYIVKSGDQFYYKDASVLCFENFGKLNSIYLKTVMQAPFMELMIKKNAPGTTVSTITISKANNYWIPLPPLEEQNRIVEKTNQLLTICNSLSQN